ncbi:MAG: molybdopterin-dependent oxidoreductase, partial [Solirubrobacteraceae bacterium]|nr:molybdopterin-dependent oxidoreductase [Solirubrobacteraceae bacterium]
MTETTWHPTACILCECNCGIEVALEDRTLARIRGDKAHPASQGYTCNKALRLDHYQNGPDRLTSPLRRRPDGTFEEIGWDEAIAEVAAGFARTRDEHGGEAILFYGGGGQGNHLGGAYAGSLLRALGARHRSSALAQEKTGEALVDTLLGGGHTRGEFEHAEVSVFVGKNPWMSQSFPRARQVLREIAKDPQRSMVVIDPVLTDTAKLADHHLRVRPGTDAWCLAALAGILVQEDLVDHTFLAEHTHGADAVLTVLRDVPVATYAERCGVPEPALRAAARRIGTAHSVAVFEDLGIQQAPNSTLCSYLNKLLWLLTGNFARTGGQHLHTWMAPLFQARPVRRTRVTGAPIINGLLPCNVIPDEILTDHPERFRAMLVESSNPAHSLADSPRMAQALDALDHLVVIDVALTETARHADYVLPAASQYEKCEATFFNLEFPHNTFHLRHPLLEPLEGTLPEPEIYARLIRALGVIDEADLEPLRAAARESRAAFAQAFGAAAGANPALGGLAAHVLYGALGPRAALRDDIPRSRAPRRPRRRRRALRRDPQRALRPRLHRRSGGRRLGLHGRRRPALHARPAGPARRGARAGGRAARLDERGVPDRALRRGAPRVHRARHLPHPGLAQARRGRRAAGQPAGRRGARPRRRG